MKPEEVYQLIQKERKYQDRKWGTVEERKQSPEAFLLILEDELKEAKGGWLKNKLGRDSYPNEMLQVAAVAFAFLEQYGEYVNQSCYNTPIPNSTQSNQ